MPMRYEITKQLTITHAPKFIH